ncbi:hypothetical protein LSH36_883g00071 [Paralvinella palmiformis]|uniref:Nucleotide-diphospho-sugar transferase domain-containing protein n=1 Tax=Paralvinella palmiformis TaxID=53620 RepID=A0AAD9MRS1_9ANNE|nr:hypothetical protein LSH36_883g00071 [Paralvinella palmiformis]
MAKMAFRKAQNITASARLGKGRPGSVRTLPVISLPIAAQSFQLNGNAKSVSASFSEAVLRYSCPYTSSVVLSFGGMGYIDMAINLYVTSYQRFNVRNHLFVGSDDRFCAVLGNYGAHCVRYFGVEASEESSSFFSKEFLTKTYLKMKVVKDAIALNVTVLLVDLDVVFLKNPLFYLGCDHCDLLIQTSAFEDYLNTGFYMMKPTKGSRRLLARTWSRIESGNYTKQNDQMIFNSVLADMRKRREIRPVVLDINAYPDGVMFFKEGGRVFRDDNPCHNCIIVHNNGLVTKEAKRYRFKEYGLWAVDSGGYYSDPRRMYIAYENPSTFESESETRTQELRALRTAFIIGHILNRTVILPVFHKDNKLSSMLPFVDMVKLDARLRDFYREHSFLSSPLVPHKTRNRVTAQFLLRSLTSIPAIGGSLSNDVIVKQFKSSALPVRELVTWFHVTPAHVLKFHSLYIDILPSPAIQNFTDIVDRVLRHKEAFRQLDIEANKAKPLAMTEQLFEAIAVPFLLMELIHTRKTTLKGKPQEDVDLIEEMLIFLKGDISFTKKRLCYSF